MTTVGIEAESESGIGIGQSASRFRGRRADRWLLAGVLIAELVALYLLLDRGGWAFDDNLYLEVARIYGFTPGVDLLGHFAPAYRAVNFVQAQLMPFSYRWGLGILLLALGAGGLLLWRIVDLLGGQRRTALVAAAYMTISVLWISPLQWWSAGLQMLPTLVLDLVCVWAYLRYQRRPSLQWVAISAGAMALGLLFYEKPAYMPLYILLIMLVRARDRRPRAIAAAIWSERLMWLGYAAVIIGYVVLREAAGAGSIGGAGTTSPSEWISFYRVLWVNTLAPALFGLRVPASGLSGIQVAAVAICQVLVVAVIVGSVVFWRRLWRAWAALFICLVANGTLLGAERLGYFGPSVANDRRYLVDFAWLVPVMLAAAWAGGAPRLRLSRPRLVGWLVAALMGIYAGASLATAAKLQHDWKGLQAHDWEQQVMSQVGAIRRRGQRPVIANGIVPFFILDRTFPPYDELSNVLPIYTSDGHVDGPLTGPIFTVDDGGNLHGAQLRVLSRIRGRCSQRAAVIRGGVPRGLVKPGAEFLRVTHSGVGKLALGVTGRLAPSAPPDRDLVLTPGAGQSLGWLGGGRPGAFVLSVPPGSGICIRRVDVVALQPAG